MFQALDVLLARGPVRFDAATSSSNELLGLLQTLVALLVVSGLAVVCLRWLARQGIGRSQGKAVQVEERIALDAQSALLVVRVERRRFLLATHRSGPARLIAELESTPVASEPEQPHG